MREHKAIAHSAPPGMPWHWTVIVLVIVFAVALIRPFAPHGIGEYAHRLAGLPLTLDIGNGRSVRLIEEPAVKTGCQSDDVRWTPDGTALVIACPDSLQVWARDGRRIGSVDTPNGWPQRHMQVLGDPLRVYYLGTAAERGLSEVELKVWDVEHGKISVAPEAPGSVNNFTVDKDQSRAALVSAAGWDIWIMSLEDGQLKQTIHAHPAALSLQWVPGAQSLLLGSFDGVLRRADLPTGEVRELAAPYTTKFTAGGGAQGSVDGLVPSPDGKSVTIFNTSSSIFPAPGRNYTDDAAAKKWDDDLGSRVQIRTIDDGRLMARAPGGVEVLPRGLAWDPRDRFIAVAGGDAVILWGWRSGGQAVMTYNDPGIVHMLSISNDGARLAVTTGNGLRILRIEEN